MPVESTRPAKAPRLRIAHIALQLSTGGLERMLTEFARHADRDRFDLRFISLGASGRMAEDIRACGWPVSALNVGAGLRPGLVFRLARLLRTEEIDVVHTHNTRPLIYAGPAARLAGVPGVIHTRHGQRRGASERNTSLFRLAARCADHIVCVSHDSAHRCAAEGIAGSVRMIWNGVDLAGPEPAALDPGAPAVFVGRLVPEKDVLTLLRAAAIVARQRPGFRLRIAGDGRSRAELEERSVELGLASLVEFIGETPDVAGLLRRSSMFVLPSLTEGLPITVLEAMAAGLPVVATRVGGTPEAVVDGRSGLLVAPGHPEELASAILRLGNDSELARRMGAEGRRRAEEHFDIRTMVARYEALYAGVARGRLEAAA